ncbi:unnamed protein product [Pleuronectes platessa]|uniref:Uncharacterized protein n=1 Tax=Pleuronectes platessa TaxID=8262 RepID=A0A9N7UZY9_PLEPL|nr:unnamed protein product [Pleuronectes platessa]
MKREVKSCSHLEAPEETDQALLPVCSHWLMEQAECSHERLRKQLIRKEEGFSIPESDGTDSVTLENISFLRRGLKHKESKDQSDLSQCPWSHPWIRPCI